MPRLCRIFRAFIAGSAAYPKVCRAGSVAERALADFPIRRLLDAAAAGEHDDSVGVFHG
jgi:hypothetical protein